MITDILAVENIFINLEAIDKISAIRKLVEIAARNNAVSIEDVVKAAKEREEKRSTGFGNGIAIPHATSDMPKMAMALARFKKPIDWQSVDNKPVTLAFLIISPKNCMGKYLVMLARLARIFSNEQNHQELMESNTSQAMFNIMNREEIRILSQRP